MKAHFNTKRHGLGLLLLLLLVIAPMTLLVSHIELLSHVSDLQGFSMTLLTHSAGSSGFLVTLAVLCSLSLLCRMTPKARVALMAQLGLILVIGFVAKTGLKHLTESPRPYTELLTHQLLIPNPSHFYKLNEAQQVNAIERISNHVSEWRTLHWQGETDYSFPSGHTIFVAICLAFFGGLFVEHKRYALAAVLFVWGVGVAYSRLWLGMHRPADLIGSVLFVSVVYALAPNFYPLVSQLWQRLKLDSYFPSKPVH
ncbi:phosphatase PAP2 family protein [Vibrio intestinalis]|uniref:phosphatase PAP2 family protein n=1 Tax=Vibrio intestinalis TaxID=2933291 RepID=UPI0021A7B6D5|nr:phosphatase PAP2 family protein [Vibrio intestinalis]